MPKYKRCIWLLETYNIEGSTVHLLLVKMFLAFLLHALLLDSNHASGKPKGKMTKNNLHRTLRDYFLAPLGSFSGNFPDKWGTFSEDLPVCTVSNTVTFLCTCFNASLILLPLDFLRKQQLQPQFSECPAENKYLTVKALFSKGCSCWSAGDRCNKNFAKSCYQSNCTLPPLLQDLDQGFRRSPSSKYRPLAGVIVSYSLSRVPEGNEFL